MEQWLELKDRKSKRQIWVNFDFAISISDDGVPGSTILLTDGCRQEVSQGPDTIMKALEEKNR
jgi:hypothetical protein